MKAVLFPGNGATTMVERPTPTPPAGFVLIELTASGVCGTDVHYWHEDATARADRAEVVPGHETVGRVAAVGDGVAGHGVGDRVVVGLLHVGCGDCAQCYVGEDAQCANKHVFGRTLDGSYGEYVIAPARGVFALPDDVPDEVAVVAACNLGTAWSACERGALRAGETVLVVGLGGVGLCAVLVASQALGADVVAVDPVAVRRDKALALGARAAVSPDELRGDDVFGAAAVALECSGNPAGQRDALAALGPGGRLVVVGMGGRYEFIAEEVIGRKLSLLGSLVCRPQEFLAVLEFAREHVAQLQSLVGPTITIDDVETGLAHMDAHRDGKVIFDWSSGASTRVSEASNRAAAGGSA